MSLPTKKEKKEVEEWFRYLRDLICESFENIEKEFQNKLIKKSPGKFKKKKWKRFKINNKGGGGEISIMKGRIFEKVGVNISTVYGSFSKEFKKQIPGCEKKPNFWACGISLVAHLHSPFIPAVHLNTRHIITTKSWFGGGADITPAIPDKKNVAFFHNSLKKTCSYHNKKYYSKFKKWCDEYFFLKHRNETRGAGGIFFDYLNTNNWQNDFSNESIQNFEVRLQSDKYGKLTASNTIIDNYTYFGLNEEDQVKPIQYDETVSYLRIKFQNNFNFGYFGLANTIMYQNVSDGDTVFNVPEVVLRHSLYYQDYWFKKALYLQAGFTGKYFSGFAASGRSNHGCLPGQGSWNPTVRWPG